MKPLIAIASATAFLALLICLAVVMLPIALFRFFELSFEIEGEI